MPVVRKNLNDCIGCQNCAYICPMDVFRFDSTEMKSVLAYPENCQTCGQCYVNCLGGSLAMNGDQFGYSITAYRQANNWLIKINKQNISACK